MNLTDPSTEQQSKIDKRARSTTMSELIPDRASAVGQRAHPDYPDWLNIAQFEFQVLRTRDELESITESWQQLADRAIEPNPFFEPMLLLPAVLQLADGADLSFVVIWARHPVSQNLPRLMTGFFPLQAKRSCLGLPIKTVAIWEHLHCFLGCPLVDRLTAKETLSTFFQWLRSPGVPGSVLEARNLPAEGAFSRAWTEAIWQARSPFWDFDAFNRAVLNRSESAETFLASDQNGRFLKNLRRLSRRLDEQGIVTIRHLPKDEPCEPWLEQFLALELSGWKGKAGSALANCPKQKQFFLSAFSAAHNIGKLEIPAIFLDDRPIAMMINLRSGKGSFSFKIAFDEQFAKYSPGTLVEIANIHQIHETQYADWMDSCADPGHPMIEHLWKESRTFKHSLISTGQKGGDRIVASLPLLRWTKSSVKPVLKWFRKRDQNGSTTSSNSIN